MRLSYAGFKTFRRTRAAQEGAYGAIVKTCKAVTMANQRPLHRVEAVFYAAASLLAIVGLAWLFFR